MSEATFKGYYHRLECYARQRGIDVQRRRGKQPIRLEELTPRQVRRLTKKMRRQESHA